MFLIIVDPTDQPGQNMESTPFFPFSDSYTIWRCVTIEFMKFEQ